MFGDYQLRYEYLVLLVALATLKKYVLSNGRTII